MLILSVNLKCSISQGNTKIKNIGIFYYLLPSIEGTH